MPQNKICHIVGAGEFAPARFTPAPGDFIIAADGGFAHLQAMGVKPDLLLGDFDSLETVPDFPNKLTLPVMKDDTDTAAALRWGMEHGYRDFRLHGGLGGRLDHTLANIQLLAALSAAGCRAFLLGQESTLTVLTDGTLTFPAGYAGTVSVFCHGDAAEGVSLRGLLYPLSEVRLTDTVPLGVSNSFLEGQGAAVTVRRGQLLLFWMGNAQRPLPVYTPL